MSSPLIVAAAHLADMLAAENTALASMDFPGAARLLPMKIAAADAFSAAQGAERTAAAGLREVATRLQQAAEENRRLLKRAMAVQTRVLGTLAQAARTASATPHYGRSGAMMARSTGAWALSSQA